MRGKMWLGCLMLACLPAVSTAATRVNIKPIYRPLTPKCADAKMTPKQQFDLARHLSSVGDAGDTYDLYACITRSALQGYAPAQLELGRLYGLERDAVFGQAARSLVSDPQAAMAWLTLASDGGEASASLQLARMHEMGDGTPQSDAEAVRWYRLGARQGISLANDLAREVENRPQRIAMFEKRYGAKAAAGDTTALMAYAHAYAGAGPYIYDAPKAAGYVQRAADLGDDHAKAVLGMMYLRGLGVPRDLEAAAGWIIKAAEGGDHTEDWQLYWLHDDAGLSPTSIAAIETANAKGILRDRFGAGRLNITPNANGEPGSRVTPAMDDLSLAALTKKAEGGDAAAQVNLGTRYLDGAGVAADAGVAKSWFLKAAQQNSDASMNLGDMAYSASPPDSAAAAQYYTAAAIMGDPVGVKNAMTLYINAGDLTKAYAMAIVLDDLKTRLGPPGFPKSLAGLDIRARAEALLFLSEQKLAHYGW